MVEIKLPPSRCNVLGIPSEPTAIADAHADARLFAAAPDLYAAAVEALNNGLDDATYRLLQAAVQKARGE